MAFPTRRITPQPRIQRARPLLIRPALAAPTVKATVALSVRQKPRRPLYTPSHPVRPSPAPPVVGVRATTTLVPRQKPTKPVPPRLIRPQLAAPTVSATFAV